MLSMWRFYLKSWLKNYQIKEQEINSRQRFANLNWPIVCDDLLLFLKSIFKDNPQVFRDFSISKTNGDCGNTGFWGFDSLQIIQNDKFTGTGRWTINNGKKTLQHEKDYGVCLDINHSIIGTFHVFLKRPKCDISTRKNPDLLLFYTDDPLELTNKKVLGFIKTMLFYVHATSIRRKLSVLDRLKLALLELRSHIRRKSMSSYMYELISNSFLAFTAVIIGAISLYVAYLTLLATISAISG